MHVVLLAGGASAQWGGLSPSATPNWSPNQRRPALALVIPGGVEHSMSNSNPSELHERISSLISAAGWQTIKLTRW
jgi:hypothetical protein